MGIHNLKTVFLGRKLASYGGNVCPAGGGNLLCRNGGVFCLNGLKSMAVNVFSALTESLGMAFDLLDGFECGTSVCNEILNYLYFP